MVTGRAKDLIIRNGENISAKEIEDILIGHPDIDEIAIVGIPDERTGERACAVIVSAENPPHRCGRAAQPARRARGCQIQGTRAGRQMGGTPAQRRGKGAEARDTSNPDERLTCR